MSRIRHVTVVYERRRRTPLPVMIAALIGAGYFAGVALVDDMNILSGIVTFLVFYLILRGLGLWLWPFRRY